MRATDFDLATHRTRERIKAHEVEGSELSPLDGAAIYREECERILLDEAEGKRRYHRSQCDFWDGQFYALGGTDDDATG